MPGTCDDKRTIATSDDSYNICGFYNTFPPVFRLDPEKELNFFFSTFSGGEILWDFQISWEEVWDVKEGISGIYELLKHSKKVFKMVNRKFNPLKVKRLIYGEKSHFSSKSASFQQCFLQQISTARVLRIHRNTTTVITEIGA